MKKTKEQNGKKLFGESEQKNFIKFVNKDLVDQGSIYEAYLDYRKKQKDLNSFKL